MRIKFPQAICYEDWIDLYSMPDYPKSFKFFRGHDDEDDKRIFHETPEMIEARKEVLAVLDKNMSEMLEIEEKMIKYMQLHTLENPPVYLAKITDKRNTENETTTLTAKTFWPLMNGKRKEIRIYMGKSYDYPDHKLGFVKIIAKQKMKEHLLERYKNGELK
ncbi:MAG: hypothetical protein HQ449_06310 [Chitinophagaceae bacterium]|nr:hypothetical protein [Chitinophagaceae bacterium]